MSVRSLWPSMWHTPCDCLCRSPRRRAAVGHAVPLSGSQPGKQCQAAMAQREPSSLPREVRSSGSAGKSRVTGDPQVSCGTWQNIAFFLPQPSLVPASQRAGSEFLIWRALSSPCLCGVGGTGAALFQWGCHDGRVWVTHVMGLEALI